MVAHRPSRSVLRLAGGLVLLAFLAVGASPAQGGTLTPAVPGGTIQLIDWFHAVLERIGLVVPEPAAKSPEEPRSIVGRDCVEIDPNGTPCANSEGTTVPWNRADSTPEG